LLVSITLILVGWSTGNGIDKLWITSLIIISKLLLFIIDVVVIWKSVDGEGIIFVNYRSWLITVVIISIRLNWST